MNIEIVNCFDLKKLGLTLVFANHDWSFLLVRNCREELVLIQGGNILEDEVAVICSHSERGVILKIADKPHFISASRDKPVYVNYYGFDKASVFFLPDESLLIIPKDYGSFHYVDRNDKQKEIKDNTGMRYCTSIEEMYAKDDFILLQGSGSSRTVAFWGCSEKCISFNLYNFSLLKDGQLFARTTASSSCHYHVFINVKEEKVDKIETGDTHFHGEVAYDSVIGQETNGKVGLYCLLKRKLVIPEKYRTVRYPDSGFIVMIDEDDKHHHFDAKFRRVYPLG